MLGDIGIAHTTNSTEQKLLRLHNRIASVAVVLVLVQTFTFWMQGLVYILAINALIITCYLFSMVLNGIGYSTFSRVFFLLIVCGSIAHHHLYFGFTSGFWLLLLAVTQ